MRIESFKGIQNTVARHDIESNACADAVDVDFTDAGGIRARDGYSLSKSATITAAYNTKERVAYCVSGGNLCRIAEDLSFIPICPSVATEFCDDQGVLFTNDGKQVINDQVINLSNPPPINQPEIFTTTSGDRQPGIYAVGYTYTDQHGLESALSPISEIELKTVGDIIVFTNHKPGYDTTIYVSDGKAYLDINGLTLPSYFIGTQSFPEDIVSLEIMNGRLYTVQRGNNYSIIRFSKHLHYHLFDYEADWFILPDQANYIKEANGSLIIACQNSCYAYSEAQGIQKLANHGAVPGRSIVTTPDNRVLIFMQRGIWSAMPFTPLTDQKTSLPMGTHCSTAIVQKNGINKFIGLHNGLDNAFNSAF
jgi:hypothetical protein